MTPTRRIAAFFLLALLAGCASEPQLLGKSASVPDGVDFSGTWTLREEPGAVFQRDGSGEPRIWIPPEKRRRTEIVRRPSRRSTGPAVRVFLETGTALKITQTEYGLFISFDRSVVEEFTFGENRRVAVGPIQAQRVSGWEGGVFVVETLDEEGARLTESWRIDEGVLVRDIAIVEGDSQHLFARQRFDKS